MNERIESLLREHLSSVDHAPVMGADLMASAAAQAGRRLRRRRRAAVATVSLGVVAIGALAVWSSRERSPRLVVSGGDSTTVTAATSTEAVTTSTEATTTPTSVVTASEWAGIAPDPRGAAWSPFVVWTGSEAISVGGVDDQGQPVAGASAYDPVSDTWRSLAASPSSSVRINALVVWTGSEMLVVGGKTLDGSQGIALANAYKPGTDTWRTFATPPGGVITDRSPAVWTGKELLVWPGDPTGTSTAITPSAYNPTSDSWRELPEPPLQRREQSATVWTGTEWVVWGGTTGQAELDDGAAYNPVTNTWRVIAGSPLSPRRVRAVWTGTEMIVAAGSAGGDRQSGNGEMALSDGAAYNPLTDTWRPIADGFAHPGFVPVWTGSKMIMFAKNGAAIYDVASNKWINTCCNDTGTGGASGGTPVWTGTTALLIGSRGSSVGGATFTLP